MRRRQGPWETLVCQGLCRAHGRSAAWCSPSTHTCGHWSRPAQAMCERQPACPSEARPSVQASPLHTASLTRTLLSQPRDTKVTTTGIAPAPGTEPSAPPCRSEQGQLTLGVSWPGHSSPPPRRPWRTGPTQAQRRLQPAPGEGCPRLQTRGPPSPAQVQRWASSRRLHPLPCRTGASRTHSQSLRPPREMSLLIGAMSTLPWTLCPKLSGRCLTLSLVIQTLSTGIENRRRKLSVRSDGAPQSQCVSCTGTEFAVQP